MDSNAADNTRKLAATTLPALRRIAQALAQADDLDTTLALIADTTTAVMAVDSCSLYLLDPDRETLRLRASTGLAARALGRAYLKVGEGLTGAAVAGNAPVWSQDAQQDPRFKWVDDTNERVFRSLLALPLTRGDTVLGALNVQTYAVHDFSADEVELLALIGDLAAGALAKAQLLDERERQLAELQTLATVSQTVTGANYLDDMLNVVCEMAAAVLDAAACAIYLWDDEKQVLILHATYHNNIDYHPQATLAWGEGFTGQVAANAAPRQSRDLQMDDDYLNRGQAMALGLVSLLGVPLSVRGRVIGVLNCYTTTPRAFPPEQVSLLDTLSNQTALAIENARLMTNAAINREMHHRIKNNLQTIVMLMRMQLSDRRRLTVRDVLHESINRIQSIAAVHEVLSERGYRLVDVNDVLLRISQATTAGLRRPDLQLEIAVHGEQVTLRSRAATALALVVNELIQNALEHAFVGRDHGRIDITLSHTPSDVHVVVRDDGLGLGGNTYRPGLGLEIAEALANDDLQGSFVLRDTGDGAEAVIHIPRALETV